MKDNFNALYEVTQTVTSILDPAELLDQVLVIAMTHLDAERGFILFDDGSESHNVSVAASKNFAAPEAPDAIAASSSVVKSVLTTGQPVLTFDALTDERFESSTSIIAQKILSIICLPLRTSDDRIVGAVYLDSTRSRKAFTDESLKFLTVFCQIASIAIANAKEFAQLRNENRLLRTTVAPTHLFPGLIGKSKPWLDVLDIVNRVLDVDASVMITGESGTGKELIARAIHENSARRQNPFVAINCSAIPESLIESELFGHMRGAFTGAHIERKGLFEVAEGGVLFLDEVGELPMHLQAKVLRAIQEREIRKVGSSDMKKINVRIIAATNKDLRDETRAGRFREDLFFRLNVVSIHLPPLRDRKEDIPLLAEFYFNKSAAAHGRNVSSISSGAMELLISNQWQGNVRELQNTIERAVVLCSGPVLTVEDLTLHHGGSGNLEKANMTLADFERDIIESTLREMGGNRTRTAERLGVSLRWLQYRLKEWSEA
ncbi:MAG TPA: sigma 54-interacting transcriptional regulator [Bacteroidota bacterium]|nr:sigma 54-interacting transcriptional regulator [Bacteroidota bacterium]